MPVFFSMPFRMRAVALVMSGALVVSSCVTTGTTSEDNMKLSNEEKALRAEDDRFNQSLITGCVAGAAAGALYSVFSKSSTGKKVTVFALTTAGGCAVGAAAGYYINQRNKEYANKQEAYRAMTAAADQDIRRYQKLNNTTGALIEQQQAKIKNLNDRYAKKEITAEGYRKQMASSNNNLTLLRNKVKEANDNIKTMEQDANTFRKEGQNTKELEKKRAALIVQRNKLEEQVELLAATYENMPPEVRPVTS